MFYGAMLQVQVCVSISSLFLYTPRRGSRISCLNKKKHFHIQAHLLLLMLSIRGNVMNKIKKENARGDEKREFKRDLKLLE